MSSAITSTTYRRLTSLSLLLGMLLSAMNCSATPNFADFDRRARAGASLRVVFFGASLTWGANASDPQWTSYRALVSRLLTAAYPKAHFFFWDAAIGGTGSQLGVFRLQRDVLSKKPDLVFLDFTANDNIYEDDIDSFASYESLVRRIILQGKAPVVQVIFPFRDDVSRGTMAGMKRRDGHLAISKAYHTAVGDAVALAQSRVKANKASIDELWPYDGAHPGDAGYHLFADAAWNAYRQAVAHKLICHVPAKMLYPDTYMSWSRRRLARSVSPPSGWQPGTPKPVSAYYDMLMTRWLDGVLIASNDGKEHATTGERLKVHFRGSTVMLFGETTLKSCRCRIYIDGVQKLDYDAQDFAKRLGGNSFLVLPIVKNLDPQQEHLLEIEPIYAEGGTELRLESICVAGGAARVEADLAAKADSHD